MLTNSYFRKAKLWLHGLKSSWSDQKGGFGLDGIPSGPRIPGLMQIVTTRWLFPCLGAGILGIPCDDLCICHCYWARGVTSKRIGYVPCPPFFLTFQPFFKIGVGWSRSFWFCWKASHLWKLQFQKVSITKLWKNGEDNPRMDETWWINILINGETTVNNLEKAWTPSVVSCCVHHVVSLEPQDKAQFLRMFVSYP